MFNLGEIPKTATLYDSEYSSKHYSDGYMIQQLVSAIKSWETSLYGIHQTYRELFKGNSLKRIVTTKCIYNYKFAGFLKIETL